MTKEDLDNEEMDSDFDETDHAQVTTTGNGHHHPVYKFYLSYKNFKFYLRFFCRKTMSPKQCLHLHLWTSVMAT